MPVNGRRKLFGKNLWNKINSGLLVSNSYMHDKSIVHINPKRSLGITVHLSDIHPLQLFNQHSEVKKVKECLKSEVQTEKVYDWNDHIWGVNL